MCGRFACTLSRADIECAGNAKVWRADDGREIDETDAAEHDCYQPRTRVSPTNLVPVIIRGSIEGSGRARSSNVVQYCRWGLIPSFAQDVRSAAGNGALLINARSESVEEKPSFRGAVRRRQFCVVPCSAFFEWKGEPGVLGKRKAELKTPYRIRSEGAAVMRLAGIYDVWTDPATKKRLWSVAILTRAATKQMAWLHDRMPCILDEQQATEWLMGTLSVHALASTSQGKLVFEKMLKDLSAVDLSKDEHAQQRNFMMNFLSPSKKQRKIEPKVEHEKCEG
ncbi:putative SOS response-associated peptidase yoqW [Porphyridium purpureum]|uniref:Putative SOS response-associated peptidase yoqW n=1 Tax=Porphyridium purpureum TaxID=35688 RepID=A0A5J4YQJ0_PORPP|nr:putative SOS response-associated peptidase yoqW [Porphyridium purpureum]|eukprot:POR8579..scf222_8